MRRLILGLTLAFALLWNVNADAQQKPRIEVVVEELEQGPSPQAATRCGITKSSLESIAVLTLRNNGILASTDRRDVNFPYLYVSVMTLQPTTDNCVFSTEITVQGFSALDVARQGIRGIKPRQVSFTVLCNEQRMDMAPTSLAGKHLLGLVETMIKLCLGKLEY